MVIDAPYRVQRVYHIAHSKGSSFMPLKDPEGTVPRIIAERNGKQTELYVTEVRGGDTGYLKGAGVSKESASFAELKGIMSRLIPDYAADRSEHFIQLGFLDDKSVYETTRLRYDLFRAAALQKSGLFTPEEKENFDYYVFRKLKPGKPEEIAENGPGKWKCNFSGRTMAKVAGYVQEKAAEAVRETGREWKYTHAAILSWLDGGVIHPTHGAGKPADLMDIAWIANAMRSDDLENRALSVAACAERAQSYPAAKDENSYFRLTDAHRAMLSLVRGIKSNEKDYKHKKTGEHKQKTRVHGKFPGWAKAVLEELAPRIEKDIVEVEIYSAGVVEIPGRDEMQKVAQPGARGLPRALITVDDNDSQRNETYREMGAREKPAKRADVLIRNIEYSIEILKDACAATVPIYIKGASVNKDRVVVLQPVLPGRLCLANTPEGEKPVINLDWLRFLSPIEEYSADVMKTTWREWDKLADAAGRNRGFRRALIREMNRGFPDLGKIKNETLNAADQKEIPDYYPLFSRFGKIYETSALLQELFAGERSFLKLVSSATRNVDAELLGHSAFNVVSLPSYTRTLISLVSELGAALSTHAEELKNLDSDIPQELTMFRSLPRVMFPSFDTENKRAQERTLFAQLLKRYGVDAGRIMSLHDGVIVHAAGLVAKRTRELLGNTSSDVLFMDPFDGKGTTYKA